MFTNQTCISTQYNPNYYTLLSTKTYFQVYVKIFKYGKMCLDDTKLRTYGYGYRFMPPCLAMGHKYNICIYCRKIIIVCRWAFLTYFSAGSNKFYFYGQWPCCVYPAVSKCQTERQILLKKAEKNVQSFSMVFPVMFARYCYRSLLFALHESVTRRYFVVFKT
jgi:hypothetical protein